CSYRLRRKSGCAIGLTHIFTRSKSENDLSATEIQSDPGCAVRRSMSDAMISAVVAGEDIYGVAAVTTTVVQQAQRIHRACPTAAAALGRLLTGGALMGCLLKDPAYRVALQVACKGPVQKIHVEADGAGHVRGYMAQPVVNLPSRRGKLDVGGAVGRGVLYV